MEWFLQLVSNRFLITALSSWFIAQVLKVIIYAVINQKLDWERLVGDGGMPSGHSATVSSLCVASLLYFGPGSFEFAITCVVSVIVCHDAMGVRHEAGKQAAVLNDLIKTLEMFDIKKLPNVTLKEFVGHTPIQVTAGILIGIANAVILHFFVF